jgi:chaperone BCS1
MRMYEPDSSSSNTSVSISQPLMSAADLAYLTAQFAATVPTGEFSPAEVHGFLLKRKGKPEKALVEVGDWVKKMMA